MDIDIEEVDEPMFVRPLSPLTSPPTISPNSSEPNHTTPTQVPKSTYEVGGTSTFTPMFVNSAQYEIYSLKQGLDLTQHKVQSMTRQMNDYISKVNSAKMDAMNAQQDLYWFKLDMSYVRRDLTHVGDIVLDTLTGLEDVKDRLALVERAQDQYAAQIHELRNRLTIAEIRLDVANFDRYQLKNEIYGMQSQMCAIQQKLYQIDVKENRPNESVDVLATYGNNDPSGLQQTSNLC
jgi:chromosome segregation ATPase